MSDVNITIIGAGVIGLAIAAELAKHYDNIFVLEKHSKFGQETSSRNSEVIHSGVYYPTNSLKAKLCVEGKKLLYDYCEEKEGRLPFLLFVMHDCPALCEYIRIPTVRFLFD